MYMKCVQVSRTVLMFMCFGPVRIKPSVISSHSLYVISLYVLNCPIFNFVYILLSVTQCRVAYTGSNAAVNI